MALKDLPEALPLKALIGPSFIILALGLGSGELILWPFLTSKYGLGLAWGAFLGITFQFFMNMEIERYALAKGESVFVGLRRLFPWSPYWFILSTFLAWAIPGIIVASASVAAHLVGMSDVRPIALAFLAGVGLILSSGTTVYGLMERITKIVLLIGAPFILLLAVLLARPTDWTALGSGLLGIGEGFVLLPVGIAIGSFLGAFAYSGAGGNLNLTQSIYVKEKGYGMGHYAQRMSGFFRAKTAQTLNLAGNDFETTPENMARWRIWWKRINLEHLIVFWGIGILTIILLMLLSYRTVYGTAGLGNNINFVIAEGAAIGGLLFPMVGTLFLIGVMIMLFQTQLGVMDSTSRIIAENVALRKGESSTVNLSKIYFIALWAQIGFGMIIIAFKIEALALITLAAVLNAIAMFVHIGLVNWMNLKVLPAPLKPAIWRRVVMLGIFLFFGVFSAITIWDKFWPK